jgi:hypothetical protein
MSSYHAIPRSGFERDSMPLDAARSAFEWLVAGPRPVSVDGRLFPGLPARRVPLNEVRDRLLRRRCPQALRDAVWAHLVLLARTEGGTWTVGCVGVALPALTSIAAKLSARFAGDPSDIHAAVLAGFVGEFGTIDLRKPRIGFRSTLPPPPWGHPDFVLARAVAEGAVTPFEAELIGATRLEGVPLADAAAERGMFYQAAKKARQRAERRLVAYLLDNAHDSAEESAADMALGTAHAGSHERDLATQAVDAVIITNAAQYATSTAASSRTVTDSRTRAGKKPAKTATEKVGDRVSPQGRISGVQGCGRKPATPAHTTTSPPEQQRLSGSTPGVSRCA